MSRKYISFTLDVKRLVNVLAQDPTCRQEIIEGLKSEKLPLTSQLGAANLADGEEPNWYSLFPATVQGKQAGEAGLFYRNSGEKFDGENKVRGQRVQMRLRPQSKPAQVATTTPGEKLNPALDAQTLAVLRAIVASAQASEEAPAGAPEIPADIADIIG